MIDILTAQKLVEKELAKISLDKRPDDERVITGIIPIQKDLGWVFIYNTRAFAETLNPDHGLIGDGPIIVDREDGTLSYLGSGTPIEEYIQEFRRKKLAARS